MMPDIRIYEHPSSLLPGTDTFHGRKGLLSSTPECPGQMNTLGKRVVPAIMVQERTAHLLLPGKQDAVINGKLNLKSDLVEIRCCVVFLGRAPVSRSKGRRRESYREAPNSHSPLSKVGWSLINATRSLRSSFESSLGLDLLLSPSVDSLFLLLVGILTRSMCVRATLS